MSDEANAVLNLLKSKWSLASPALGDMKAWVIGPVEIETTVKGPTIVVSDNSTRPNPITYGATPKYNDTVILTIEVWTAKRADNDTADVAKDERDAMAKEIKRIIRGFPTSAVGIKTIRSSFRWQPRDRSFMSPPNYGYEVFVDCETYS